MGFIAAARMRSLQGKAAAAAAVVGLVVASAGVVVSTAGMASAGNDNPVICHTTGSGSISIAPSGKNQGHKKHGEADGDECEPGTETPETPAVNEPKGSSDKGCEKSGAKPKKCNPAGGPEEPGDPTVTDPSTEGSVVTDDTPVVTDDKPVVPVRDDAGDTNDSGGQPVTDKPGNNAKPGKGAKPGSGGKHPGAHSGGKHPSAGHPVVLGAEKAATPKKDARSAKGPRAGQPAVVAPASLQVGPRVAVPTTVSAGLGAGPQLTGVGTDASAALGGRMLGGGLLRRLGAAALSRGNRPSQSSAS
jgi:hypothetical protein